MRLIFFIIIINLINIYGQKDPIIIYVTDITNAPIPYATLELENLSLRTKEAYETDSLGKISIELQPSNYIVHIDYLGFDPYHDTLSISKLSNPRYHTITLIEDITKLADVVLTEQILDNTTPGSISYKMEKASKFAGNFDDPLRVATSFASTSSAGNDAYNYIIIRGNSPNGQVWKVNGVEVPVPCHFGSVTLNGGGLSMFKNSDLERFTLHTTVLPPSAGNATTGSFELELKKPNTNKQISIEAGLLGINLAYEGKLYKKISTITRYRYATLSVLGDLGYKFQNVPLPRYSDVYSLIRYESKFFDKLQIWGIFGGSRLVELPSQKKHDYNADIISLEFGKKISSKLRFDYSVQLSQNKSIDSYEQTLQFVGSTSKRIEYAKNYQNYFRNNLRFEYQIHKSILLQAGADYLIQNSALDIRNWVSVINADTTISIGEDQNFSYLNHIKETFVNFIYKNDNLTINAGMHSLHSRLSNNPTIEPRINLKYQLLPTLDMQFGIGRHNRARFTTPIEKYPQADHIYTAYNYSFKKHNFKSEVYYMHHSNLFYNSLLQTSSINLLNSEGFGFTDTKSTAFTKGVDLTYQYQYKMAYAIITSSLYDTKYRAQNVYKDAQYNARQALSVLIGKDFTIRSKNKISCNFKYLFIGGFYYTPIDTVASLRERYSVYKRNEPLSARTPAYTKIDVQVKYTTSFKNYNIYYKLEISNLFNRKNFLNTQYSASQHKIITINNLGIIPILSIGLEFK